MNDVIETILKRRSIRAYKEEQIPDGDLKILLTCALYAPTGGNLQNSRFLVIQKPELLSELNEAIQKNLAAREAVLGEMMTKGILRARTPGYHFIFHAPTLILAVAPRDHSNSMANCCCGLENIQIAAASMGLGSCWSNQLRWLTGEKEIRERLKKVGLRDDEDVFGGVSVGYPAVEPRKAAERREGRIQTDCGIV